MAENTEAFAAISQTLRSFLRPQEKVLLCNGAEVAAKATEALGATVLCCDGKHSWQSLLRYVFSQRITVLMGSPKVILSLGKCAKVAGIPLPVRHVVLLEAVENEWLLEGIQNSLDARIHICDLSCGDKQPDPLWRQLDEMLLSWSSILDYRAKRTEQGLCLEIIVFPGRKLPQLPSGASVTVRPWNPAADGPVASWKA